MRTHIPLLAAATLAASIALTGCTSSGEMNGMDPGNGSDSSATDSASTFNDADVTFATMMIPHHQQAVEMAEMLLDKDGIDERVTNLALAIKDAQQPEIDTMTEWLDSWGQPYDDMGGMDHGGDGMMSDDDMAALESATGAEASTLFLEQMTQHHEGAIAMAKQEVSSGDNPDAIALAQSIIDSQTAEIDTMQGILATL
ncbi:MAG: DUF305 domain-containing protein [Ilumatobacteraceae bacterium]